MAGKYNTKQQQAIRECLENNKDGYVTAVQIQKYLEERDIKVGLTTVYRKLESMESEGIVTKINVENVTGACYQYVEGNNQPGFYIQCEKCGMVEKMSCGHLDELYHHVKEDHHFSVNTRRTVLYGCCQECEKVKESVK